MPSRVALHASILALHAVILALHASISALHAVILALHASILANLIGLTATTQVMRHLLVVTIGLCNYSTVSNPQQALFSFY